MRAVCIGVWAYTLMRRYTRSGVVIVAGRVGLVAFVGGWAFVDGWELVHVSKTPISEAWRGLVGVFESLEGHDSGRDTSGCFWGFWSVWMLPGIGAQKNPRTLGSEGAGYLVSRVLGGGVGSSFGAVARAKKNASLFGLAFYSRGSFLGG